jgi:hypothetical protein
MSAGHARGHRCGVLRAIPGRDGRRLWRCGLGRRRAGWRPRPGRDPGEHRARWDGLVRLNEDLGQRSGGRGGHLGVHLVGGDLHKLVAFGYRIAHLFQPLEHRALGDRVAHLGELDVDELGFGRGRLGGRGSRSIATDLDDAEHRAHGHGLVRLDEDLRQRSGGRGGHLRVDLVSRDV